MFRNHALLQTFDRGILRPTAQPMADFSCRPNAAVGVLVRREGSSLDPSPELYCKSNGDIFIDRLSWEHRLPSPPTVSNSELPFFVSSLLAVVGRPAT